MNDALHLRALADQAKPWPGPLPEPDEFARLRKACGLSREKGGALIGASSDSILRYETGSVTTPRALSSIWARKVLTVLHELAGTEELTR